MDFCIARCWDSHAHLMFTGMAKYGLQLNSVFSANDLKNLKLERHHFRGEWLVGFGWDQFHFSEQRMPTCFDLDQIFPNEPVCFTRKDGHALWVNSEALKKVKNWPEKIQGGEILRLESGAPSGILIDRAMALVEPLIPGPSWEAQMFFIQEAIQIFNSAGFSHVRDMGGTETQWQILCELESKNQLGLYVEQNLFFDRMDDFPEILQLAQRCSQEKHTRLRFVGVKFFIDGALGSEGAWLSRNYTHSKSHGFSLWSSEQIEEILHRTWGKKLPVAIHALGDAAVEQVADVAMRLREKNIWGELNIEHAEVVQESTIQKLLFLGAKVHMQPCHWLSDQIFLKEKLGDLYGAAFPWAKMQQAGVSVFWGSDAPIERPSVFNNWKALRESAEAGIPRFQGNLLEAHSHPDVAWGSACRTHFNFEISENPVAFHFE